MKEATNPTTDSRPQWSSVVLAFSWIIAFSISNFLLEFIKEFEGDPMFGFHTSAHWHRRLSYPLFVDAWLFPAFFLAIVILAKDRFIDRERIKRWNLLILAFCVVTIGLGVVSYCETLAVMHQWVY